MFWTVIIKENWPRSNRYCFGFFWIFPKCHILWVALQDRHHTRTFDQLLMGLDFIQRGATTKINDLIFVVLAERERPSPRWLTLSSLPCLTLSSTRQPICLDLPLIAASRPPYCSRKVDSSARFPSHRGEKEQSAKQMCWEDSWHSPARPWWPGLVLGSWERGKRSRRNRQSTQQLTPPLISISSYSHKPICLSFQHKHCFSFVASVRNAKLFILIE